MEGALEGAKDAEEAAGEVPEAAGEAPEAAAEDPILPEVRALVHAALRSASSRYASEAAEASGEAPAPVAGSGAPGLKSLVVALPEGEARGSGEGLAPEGLSNVGAGSGEGSGVGSGEGSGERAGLQRESESGAKTPAGESAQRAHELHEAQLIQVGAWEWYLALPFVYLTESFWPT